MSVEQLSDGTLVVTGDAIGAYRLLSLRGSLKLECRGLRRRGRSAYAQVKAEFGLRGNKQRVLEQFEDLLHAEGILR